MLRRVHLRVFNTLSGYYPRIKAPKTKTLKGYSRKTLIRNVRGGDKLKNFYTQKSVEIELPPHQDPNYFRNKSPPSRDNQGN